MTPVLPMKTPARFGACCHLWAVYCAIALGFALPISMAASNILLALVLLFSLLAGQGPKHWQILRQQPAALLASGFCLLALLACSWDAAGTAERQLYLNKYLTLLLIPLLLPLFAVAETRHRAISAFLAAMGLTLLLSILLWLGALDTLPPRWLQHISRLQDPDYSISQNAVVFKLSITHGFFMAIAAYLWLLRWSEQKSSWQGKLYLLLSLLACSNVLLMIIGRTGYVVLAVLGIYFYWTHEAPKHPERPGFKYRRRLQALALCLLLSALGWQFSGNIQQRIDQAISEARHWQPDQGDRSSIGLRLDYYHNTMRIIAEHPWLGVGTGGFPGAYQQQIAGTAMAPSNNPHNQYLLTTAQLGLLGLAWLLLLHATLWQAAVRLEAREKLILRGVLLAYLLGNLFNSFLFDASERLFFAWLTGLMLAGCANPPARSRRQAAQQPDPSLADT